MIPALVSLTLRALLNRRRTLLLALLGGLLMLVAALFRLGDPTGTEATRFTGRLVADFGLAVLLPLVTVIVGTAAVGSELDDGTIVYLLSKPVPRWLIILVKLSVTWVVGAALVAIPILLGGTIGTGGDVGIGAGYAVASLLGALEYTAAFIALSLVTSRALVVGLAYVVVWEGVVAGLFAGTRVLSIRQHALAVGDALVGEGAVTAELELSTALLVGGAVIVLATALAMRRLMVVELRGETG